jgi:hypothetical protein
MRDGHDTLVIRARRGDREAVYELISRMHPLSLTELVRSVFPAVTPRPWQFDALADAFDAHAHRQD